MPPRASKSTRQTVYNRRRELAAMRAVIPPDCPITVADIGGRFHVMRIAPGRVLIAGRHQTVAAFVSGFARGWRERAELE
jgi:hypothetical protein